MVSCFRLVFTCEHQKRAQFRQSISSLDKKRIFLDQEEKSRLMKLGQAIGSDLKHIINIVHADTLWQCDFLSKPMWASKGLVDVYLLVFLHLGSRRVWISPRTVQPDSAWVSLQARNFLMVAEDMGLAP
jgi:hypothetical protein